MSVSSETTEQNGSLLGVIAGPLIAVFVWLLLPESYIDAEGVEQPLSAAARSVAAVAIWMAVWWVTEAISVYATALLPLAAFPLLDVAPIKDVAIGYGSPVVYLFLGGFILALAIEKWGLHRRIALTAVAMVGTSPRAIIGAFMAVAAILSMWITNIATTMTLLPVALSVIALLPAEQNDNGDESASSPFAVCLLLGIAYAASIGGMGTIIGTAPNVFTVSFIEENLGFEIAFVDWMRFAVPVVIVFVPIVWFVLTHLVFPVRDAAVEGAAEKLRAERDELPPLSRGEILTLTVFLVTASAWVARPWLDDLVVGGVQPFAQLTDPGIAVLAALTLFVIPVDVGKRQFIMDWRSASKLPWGLLILFGGGLALAAQLSQSGFSAYMGHLAGVMGGYPGWVIVLLVTASVVFLTEMTSNTATTATLIPVFYAVSIGLELPPLMLILPATLAASCAFMLPVATPPNAVVFGSGLVQVKQMSRVGIWLNLIAIGLLTVGVLLIMLPALGITG